MANAAPLALILEAQCFLETWDVGSGVIVLAMEPPLGLAVVGLGVHCAVGRTADSAAAAVRAGVSRIREHDHMVDRAGDPFRVANDPELDAPLRRAPRIAELAVSATRQVLPPLEGRGLTKPVPVLLCLPEPAETFSEADAVQTTTRLGRLSTEDLQLTARALQQGNAGLAVALQSAHALLQGGSAEACIVVGADSYLDPDLLEPLDEAGRMMTLSNRWGFPPGEGAGALLIISRANARPMSLPILAEIHGVGLAQEPHGRDSDGVNTGEALADAFRQSVRKLGEPVAAHYCDIDGDRYREHELSFAIHRVHPDMFDDVTAYTAPADCWGSVGAASLPMLSAVAIARSHRDGAQGSTLMAWAGSENGTRGCVVYREPGSR